MKFYFEVYLGVKFVDDAVKLTINRWFIYAFTNKTYIHCFLYYRIFIGYTLKLKYHEISFIIFVYFYIRVPIFLRYRLFFLSCRISVVWIIFRFYYSNMPLIWAVNELWGLYFYLDFYLCFYFYLYFYFYFSWSFYFYLSTFYLSFYFCYLMCLLLIFFSIYLLSR